MSKDGWGNGTIKLRHNQLVEAAPKVGAGQDDLEGDLR